MKELLLAIAITAMSSSVSAYNIGGEHVSLVSCNWGKYGYQYGNIGTYRAGDGQIYRIFFGGSYCQY